MQYHAGATGTLCVYSDKDEPEFSVRIALLIYHVVKMKHNMLLLMGPSYVSQAKSSRKRAKVVLE